MLILLYELYSLKIPLKKLVTKEDWAFVRIPPLTLLIIRGYIEYINKAI